MIQIKIVNTIDYAAELALGRVYTLSYETAVDYFVVSDLSGRLLPVSKNFAVKLV